MRKTVRIVLNALETVFLLLCFKWELSDGGRHSMLKGRGRDKMLGMAPF